MPIEVVDSKSGGVEPDEVETGAGTKTDADEVELEAVAAASEDEVVDPEAEERARVEAAIRAGEEAAEREMAADAGKYRDERDELQKQLSDAEDELKAAKKEAADATNRLLRVQADWENYRRRTNAEREDEKKRASEDLVVKILPVIDDLERAIDHAGKVEGNEQLTQFVDGVSAVHAKLLDALAQVGVEVIDPLGEPFDPQTHQAIARVQDTDAYDETIASVYLKGYRMGGKLIRSPMVTVTYGGPKRPEDDAGKDA